MFYVAIDIRVGSPTFGQWVRQMSSSANGEQIWAPLGFAPGPCSLEPDILISYELTDFYNAAYNKGVAWDDPAMSIVWSDIAGP